MSDNPELNAINREILIQAKQDFIGLCRTPREAELVFQDLIKSVEDTNLSYMATASLVDSIISKLILDKEQRDALAAVFVAAILSLGSTEVREILLDEKIN